MDGYYYVLYSVYLGPNVINGGEGKDHEKMIREAGGLEDTASRIIL